MTTDTILFADTYDRVTGFMDGTSNTLAAAAKTFAFEAGFTGGVRVASGDINGDGVADIVLRADVDEPAGLLASAMRDAFGTEPETSGEGGGLWNLGEGGGIFNDALILFREPGGTTADGIIAILIAQATDDREAPAPEPALVPWIEQEPLWDSIDIL